MAKKLDSREYEGELIKVLDGDTIDAYIDLKMEDVIRLEHTPHPVEFDIYYSY